MDVSRATLDTCYSLPSQVYYEYTIFDVRACEL
jgi:hypothetical protein